MINIGTMSTAVRVLKKNNVKNAKGHVETTFTDIFGTDIFCEWTNSHGSEAVQAATTGAKETAKLKMWFMPEINQTLCIKRLPDNAIFEIISIDNVKQRNQQLELIVKRWTEG